MKLLEYEAKSILAHHAIPVPKSGLVTPNLLLPSYPLVLKSQVPTGGRGKLGGVVIVNNENELRRATTQLSNLPITGFLPKVILAEEKLAIKRELYLSLLIDRETATIRLIAHTNGGVEVENNDSSAFLNIEITGDTVQSCGAQLSTYFNYDEEKLTSLVSKLYSAFIKNDATLIEINPLVITKSNTLVCGDCKMELDDTAAFRHPEWKFEASFQDANFVTLDKNGTVATIANGAGLAMATVDAVATSGMKPANFLDIGGGASTETILAAFRRIMEFPHIQAIVINIFAGITRCDEVANAIIAAKEQIESLPPLFIRLAGTNAEQASQLLTDASIATLPTLDSCIVAAREVTHG